MRAMEFGYSAGGGLNSILWAAVDRLCEHLIHALNPTSQGAIDFKVYTEESIQISDKKMVLEIILNEIDTVFDVRIILHDVNTATESPHIHVDKRTDIGHLIETKGRYRQLKSEMDQEEE